MSALNWQHSSRGADTNSEQDASDSIVFRQTFHDFKELTVVKLPRFPDKSFCHATFFAYAINA